MQSQDDDDVGQSTDPKLRLQCDFASCAFGGSGFSNNLFLISVVLPSTNCIVAGSYGPYQEDSRRKDHTEPVGNLLFPFLLAAAPYPYHHAEEKLWPRPQKGQPMSNHFLLAFRFFLLVVCRVLFCC